MAFHGDVRLGVFLSALLAAGGALGGEPFAAALPEGVKAVWDLDKANRQTTPTRERIWINGLWRWQPARGFPGNRPEGGWGYFKVPGAWPGITDYMQKDCQTVFAHPRWRDERLGSVTAAWHQREIELPGDWAGRRITLTAEYLNSYAAVYVDGTMAGELRFPGGELDLTAACRPGAKHLLSLLVVAMPLQGVMLSYQDTASAREVRGSVARRGLCGDVYVASTPPGPRIADVKIDPSVRRGRITLDVALEGLAAQAQYALRVRIAEGGRSVKEFTSKPLKPGDLAGGRVAIGDSWKPDKLWDLHTPANTCEASVSLLDSEGKLLDTAWPERFGFREFWIDGRDFYLNGARVFLSGVPLDNAQVSAALACYEGAKESLLRLKRFGINFVYTHNYGCEPGSHLGFAEVLRAADDVGMLVSFSQPHFAHYDWRAPDADQDNGYARHAEFYVRRAQNHPSVVFYSMSHNATGYSEDMNPDMIDGVQDGRDAWARNNAKLALRAEAIVKRLDPGRIVYHHASGNLGSMHTSNFYPNFAPVQELSDWFEHWATRGVKPAFTCEYGAPFTWDWAMYRGWYRGERSFGSARVPWEFCFAEWNAQLLGDRAFRLSEAEKANLRWEAKQFRAGRLWHRWDYPYEIGSRAFDDRHAVFATYLGDNWRAFRTWGLSANSPWEHGHFWRLRDGVDKGRKPLPVDWEHLQRPGFSPDYLEGRYERMDLAFERSDWIATPAAEALIRNNQPLLAYIAGKPARFTSKDHNFLPGETVEKQIVIINNSRQPVTCDCGWRFNTGRYAGERVGDDFGFPLDGVRVETGQQKRLKLSPRLPPTLAPGAYEIALEVRFDTGERQKDAFPVHVLAPSPPLKTSANIALFDPKGETRELLGKLGVAFRPVEAGDDLSGADVLIVGKAALTADGPGPNASGVRDGLKVIVFEQTAEVLQNRLGFRVAEYGLRNVFARVADHPLLAGLGAEHLGDWRGAATLLAPRLKYEMRPRHGPTVLWCDIPVTRVWRCGNQGNVASVLIEKPTRGDFLPILDGGFSLQYSPLLEYREGRGMVLFCQMDVTGRTESDPAAERLARNILQYVSHWRPRPRRTAWYAGEAAGKRHLDAAGVSAGPYRGSRLAADDVLVAGPGAGQELSAHAPAIRDWLKAGGHLLAIGLDAEDAAAILPFPLSIKRAEHIATCFEPFAAGSLLAGIGPADVHNRDPKELPLVTGGATVIGNGVLAKADSANVVFFQLAPWQFDYGKQYNLKRTYRRASFAVSRLLAGMGAGGSTPLLARFASPVPPGRPEKRWLDGLYLDAPEEWDDPYRFFRW